MQQTFGRRLLAALANPAGYVRDRAVERLTAENAKLRAELARKTEYADRYRTRHDEAARNLSTARATLMKVSMVKCWTNEDGKRFVFVTDLQDAMGVPRDDRATVEGGQ